MQNAMQNADILYGVKAIMTYHTGLIYAKFTR